MRIFCINFDLLLQRSHTRNLPFLVQNLSKMTLGANESGQTTGQTFPGIPGNFGGFLKVLLPKFLMGLRLMVLL